MKKSIKGFWVTYFIGVMLLWGAPSLTHAEIFGGGRQDGGSGHDVPTPYELEANRRFVAVGQIVFLPSDVGSLQPFLRCLVDGKFVCYRLIGPRVQLAWNDRWVKIQVQVHHDPGSHSRGYDPDSLPELEVL